MTLDQLRYFLAAANFQHVGRAARSVSISASVISTAISNIEDELKCALFRKNGRGIVLTPEGEIIKKKAAAILYEVSLLPRSFAETDLISGRFRLGASPFLANHFLASTIAQLQKENPEFVAEVYSIATSVIVNDVIAGKLDGGLCFSTLMHPDIVDKKIFNGQMLIAVRKNHPVFKAKDPLKEISKYPATIHKANQGVEICENHPIFDQFNIGLKTNFFFDSDDVAVNKLCSSDGWSLLPDVVINQYKNELRPLTVPGTWNAPYNVSYIRHRQRSPNALDRSITKLISAEIERTKISSKN